MPEKRKKSRYEIKLLDEKRAFVVVALTKKFSLAGKAAAANALAHYDSRKGYAYVAVPTIAAESGYSPSSTKTINGGLDEMERTGAFNIKRSKGGAKGASGNVHHICPNMAWFRAEYDLLRKSGRIDKDEFADIRDDQEEDNSGFQPEMKSGSEQENPSSGLDNSGSQLENPGSGPDEEDQGKRTLEENQEKKTNPIDPSAPRRDVPAVGFMDHSEEQPKPPANNNDQGEIEPWPDDIVDKFLSYYPKGGDCQKISKALEEIRLEGRTKYSDILRGASNYKYEQKSTEIKFIKSPENFLKERLYAGYQQRNRPEPKKAAAI
jgi:hypothetical protein